MLDLHARTTPAAAIQFGRLLADYNLYWYEEPCWPEHVDALVEVARALPFPIATGERLVGRWEFRELLGEARLRHHPARRLSLRRHQRRPSYRRHGGDLFDRRRLPQSAGAGQYSRVRCMSASPRRIT